MDAKYPSGTWRYRMTVVVETPEGTKTGSAVREVHAYMEPELLGVPTGGHTKLKAGEAIVIDLGSRGVLFALLRGGIRGPDYGWAIVYNAFPFANSTGETTKEVILHYRELKAGKVTLPPKLYPMFVRFRDLNDPKTVERVGPKSMQKIFGDGVEIREVTIEMTSSPVSWGIEKWLPWLPERKKVRGTLGGGAENPFQDPTGLYLTGIEFSKGKFW